MVSWAVLYEDASQNSPHRAMPPLNGQISRNEKKIIILICQAMIEIIYIFKTTIKN